MNISQLKRKAAIQFIFYLLLSIVLILLSACLIIYNGRVCDKNRTVAEKIRSIDLQIIEIQKKEAILNKNLDLWKTISSSNLHSSRYISNLNFELSKLYKKHSILEPEISISTPERAKFNSENENTIVIRSEVVLNLSSICDKNIFLFLRSILDLPGYIMIKSFFLKKQRNIDTETINLILSGHMIEIVRANVIFDWYTILSK